MLKQINCLKNYLKIAIGIKIGSKMKSDTSKSEDRVNVASESSTRLRLERLLNFVQEEAGGPSSTTGSSFSSSSCSTANEWCIWQCHREVKAHWLENQFYSRVRAALPTAHCKFLWNSVLTFFNNIWYFGKNYWSTYAYLFSILSFKTCIFCQN